MTAARQWQTAGRRIGNEPLEGKRIKTEEEPNMGKLHGDSEPRYVKVMEVPEGQDHRDNARYHIKMIMATQHVMIIDNKFKPLKRSMKLDVSPKTISEDNYAEIFADVVEALRKIGEIGDDESAVCITFPAGTTQIVVPLGGQA
jgi:hypothetical protein